MFVAKLLTNSIAGLARNELGESIPTNNYIGQTGDIVEIDEDEVDSDTTGYASVYYLVNFGKEKLWLPSRLFMGWDEEEQKDIWVKILEIREIQ